jgi:4-diphosphocytidyl-2-C-methyl-D-erythritol kinase
MKILAPAKLNLFLHITGRRSDGYHLLQSLFVFTAFGDDIVIEPSDKITLTIDGDFYKTLSSEPIEENLVYRAAVLLQKKYHVTQGACIHIKKNIPVGAGLGGGSSDAAAVLKRLNTVWNLQLSTETLCEIGLSLGADVPSCIVAKPAVISGVGEVIQPTTLPFAYAWVLLVNPNKPLSTQRVFQEYKKNNNPFSVIMDDTHNTKQYHNDLEPIAILLLPEIQIILDQLNNQTGCTMTRMSGSGPTCFALFSDLLLAKQAEKKLRERFPNYWIQLSTL